MNREGRRLVLVGTYATLTEAELVRARLESEGIAAMVRQDDAGGMLPELSWRKGPQVMVRACDLELAQDALAPDTQPPDGMVHWDTD